MSVAIWSSWTDPAAPTRSWVNRVLIVTRRRCRGLSAAQLTMTGCLLALSWVGWRPSSVVVRCMVGVSQSSALPMPSTAGDNLIISRRSAGDGVSYRRSMHAWRQPRNPSACCHGVPVQLHGTAIIAAHSELVCRRPRSRQMWGRPPCANVHASLLCDAVEQSGRA